jgi:hypothetical protein
LKKNNGRSKRGQCSLDSFSRTHIIEFHKDKTVVSKLTVDRTLVQTIEGKLSGIQVTSTGHFAVLLGEHTVNGRTQPRGQLGEFYYLGKGLFMKDNNVGHYILNTVKPLDGG